MRSRRERIRGFCTLQGLVVLFWPEFGGYLVAAWLAGIILNLLTAGPVHYYDVALRDFGLLLGALALARLAAGVRLRAAAARDAYSAH